MTADSSIEFEIKAKDCEAKGRLTDNGFLVRSGAVVRKDIVASAQHNLPPLRKKLTSAGVIAEIDGQLLFAKDHVFDSPSGAAAAVMGRTANGWIEWKTADGRSLGNVMRKSPDSLSLGPDKRKQILDTHNQMLADGKLLSDKQLTDFYTAFRERFNTDVLSSTDGQALLELMHDHSNRDSLVYWLEFKNDEEFQTRVFGSIAGGSALKFGIFRRKETGHWQSADETNRPHDIPVDEAIAVARRNRDQLVQGINLLSAFTAEGSDDEYAELQSRMDELAPDVSNLAWGHKYFSLFFPDKLDDFHSPLWQHFHILRLLQLPPEGEGRYLCAGRFTSGAREVGLSMNHFTGVLNAIHGALHPYWRVNVEPSLNQQWQTMKGQNCIALDWTNTPDLGWVKAEKTSREQLKKLVIQANPAEESNSGKVCTQITSFVARMQKGDVVVAADGNTVVGLGRVTGGYSHNPESTFPHQRPVEWLDLSTWQLPAEEGLSSEFGEIKKYDENILEIERHLQVSVAKPLLPEPTAVPPRKNIELDGIPGRIQSALARKGQVVLYGPPGTGKTYWAERAANSLAAISVFGKTFDDLTDDERNTVTSEEQGLVRWSCFHPAYGYEDFIEGYRPITQDKHIQFELRDGIFKRLCDDAIRTPDRNFYLIVDEINRGDIPRIFGELLTILEKDKRGKRVLLPVSQRAFRVPDNVFIIGTMNTADRSISLLDAALRRRFGFIELMPDGAVLRDAVVKGVPLRAWFDALNQRIREHVGRDARNLQIGHSYLMSSGSPLKDFAALKRVIRDDIIPLLEEYCYEDFGALQNILGNGLLDVAKQQIRHELFDDDQDDNLIQALLEPCPEIATSTDALDTEEATDEAEDELDGAEEVHP